MEVKGPTDSSNAGVRACAVSTVSAYICWPSKTTVSARTNASVLELFQKEY